MESWNCDNCRCFLRIPSYMELPQNLCPNCLLERHIATGEPLSHSEVEYIVGDGDDVDFVAVGGGLWAYDKSLGQEDEMQEPYTIAEELAETIHAEGYEATVRFAMDYARENPSLLGMQFEQQVENLLSRALYNRTGWEYDYAYGKLMKKFREIQQAKEA